MAEFTNDGDTLYIDGNEVLHGWESFNGWYWFATEKVEDRGDDTIWFGYVQGTEEEWGNFSQAELEAIIKTNRAWKIPQKNLHYSGRRHSND